MKRMKPFLTLLITLTFLLGACQPQTTPTPVPALNTPVPVAAASTVPEVSPTATEAPQVQKPALTANLSELKGTVDIKQAGQESFAPAKADDKLAVDGQVQTGSDGRVRLDLSTGTIIRVAPTSLFTLTSNEEVDGSLLTKIKLELGKVFIILNGGNAEVQTPSGVAAVQGSYLRVGIDPATGDITLTCLEGDCSVTPPDGEKKSFTDGQKITIHKDPATGALTVDEGLMSSEDFQEWLDNNPEAKDLVGAALSGTSGSGGGGAGGGGCAGAIQPVAGSVLPYQGRVKFEWNPQPKATKYIVKFVNANGTITYFETTNTSIDPYIEGFAPDAGTADWSVTALGDSGEICTSEPVSFTKPESNPEPEPDVKNEDPAPPAPEPSFCDLNPEDSECNVPPPCGSCLEQ